MENEHDTEPRQSEYALENPSGPQPECKQPECEQAEEQRYARSSEFDNFVVCTIVGGMIFALLFVGFAIYDFVSKLP